MVDTELIEKERIKASSPGECPTSTMCQRTKSRESHSQRRPLERCSTNNQLLLTLHYISVLTPTVSSLWDFGILRLARLKDVVCCAFLACA